MNRKEFVRELEKAGCQLHRSGGRHDIFLNPTNGRRAPVPRHREIKNTLCELIRQQLGLK
ncbi:MAG TPA: type II toxin-antitoxin system HicA family toxin [Vicinamibacteria bacterium]|nr:type II toxin-antitoxin system HicA family toxin [Vicinamibacteria bacterium]